MNASDGADGSDTEIGGRRAEQELSHTLMQPDLEFDSVACAAVPLPNWLQLCNEDPLVQLHSKFWGKNLTYEESESSDNQTHTESGLSDGDERMDVDDVGDFVPGCAIFNIGIDCFPFEKIWIRADYIRVYDLLESREAPLVRNRLAPAAVVTGLPGIGKSVWVYYALCRRLVERKAVILYRDQTHYLFLKAGVFQSPLGFPSSHFRTFVWTLVDSDDSKDGTPPRLLTPGTRLYVIYVTSPRKERWSRMGKTTRDVTIIMNPWSKKEINIAASIYATSPSDYDHINLLFDRLGPTPRLCLDFFEDAQRRRRYECDLQKAISNITSESLEALFDAASTLEMDNLSHKICMVRRDSLEDVASGPIVEVITPYIRSKLVYQLRILERRDQVRLYKRFEKTSDSRALAGVAFEAAGQAMLQDGIDLALVPMVHLPPKTNDRRPQWHSSHVLLRDAALEQLRQDVLRKTLDIQVRPDRIVEYTDNGPLSIEPNVFYLPSLSNQVAFDAFILLNGIISLFQFTIGEHDDIKLGLKDFFATCSGVPALKNWRIVFIVPPNHTLICPQPWFLDIPVYSAVITL